jgi:hypothetical protein
MTREERIDVGRRRTAALLIRCMDSGDQRGAEAIVTRLAAFDAGTLDAVLGQVWRIEADRAARQRAWRASPAWRAERRPVGVLRLAAEVDVLLAAVVAAVAGCAEDAGWLGEPEGDRVQPCGTYAAFRHHEDRGELIDIDCADAARAYWREAKRRRRAREASRAA